MTCAIAILAAVEIGDPGAVLDPPSPFKLAGRFFKAFDLPFGRQLAFFAFGYLEFIR